MSVLTSAGSYAVSARTWILAHKIISAVLAVIIIGGAWSIYARATSTTGQTLYILGTVSRSTIISTVSGSGQVSPSNQVEIKPKASGEITNVLIQEGDSVRAGQTLAYIDATDAQKAVRDAQANVESAKIALQKLKAPPTALTLTQSQNALANAKDALAKEYADSQTDIVNAFLDFPEILTGLQNIVTGTNTNTNMQWNIDFYLNATEVYDIKTRSLRDTAYNDYVSAKKSYDSTFAAYQAFGQNPDQVALEKMLNDTYTTTNLLSRALKSNNTFVQFYSDTMTNNSIRPSSVATTALTDLNTYIGTVNTHLSTLLAHISSLKSNKQTVIEKQQSLDETNAGTDALDLQSSQLSVTKAENALLDAQNDLADYSVRAPFAGTLAKVDAKKGDSASAGTAIATIITKDQIAELSLNEVDAAKLKTGQKASLTFDAIDGLSIAGTVASVDTLGTVTQGVVSYAVKINFSTQDTRVKPGMTVNANIITETAQDALVIPSGAVKTLNEESFVQVFRPALPESPENSTGVATKLTPQSIPVQIGISDDTSVQILSGLELGQQIVIRTTTAAAVSTAVRTGTGSTRSNGGFSGPPGAAIRGI